MIKGAKALSSPFLNTETVSYGCGYTTTVFLARNIMAIVLSENICLFTQLKLQKPHKVERGHELFIPMKG